MRSSPALSSTRDPARSETSTPLASSIETMALQRMSAGVGFEKTRFSVFRCLVLMVLIIVPIWYHVKYHMIAPRP